MVKNKEIYAHIGLPKTGSTFLQRYVFPEFKGIKYIKKRLFYKRKEIITPSKSHKFLLSHECIIKANSEGLIEDNARITSLSADYPQAKIILFFRRHDSWVKSKYFYYIRKNGYRTFDQYLDLKDDSGLLKLEKLEYKRDIHLIEEYFSHKPLILFHEELVRNPYRTIAFLAEYMGITYQEKDIHFNPINVAFNQKQLKAIRLFNTFFRYKPSKNRVKTIRRIHKNIRKLAVHTVGLLSLGFPDFLLKNKEPLIPPEKLTHIRERFADDWQYCLDYARKQRELFL